MNIFVFDGFVGIDPEMKETAKGKIATISVGNKTGYGEKEKTSWFKCTAFAQKADFISKYVKKGSKVAISGQCIIEEYQGKYYTKVYISDIEFQSSGKKQDKKKDEQTAEEQPLFDDCTPLPNEPDFS